MQKPEKHILLCASFRTSGEPQGVCHKKGAADLLAYIENELSDRGLSEVALSSTGCLKACDRGPVMVIYPQNAWYGGVESEEIIDNILDAMEKDTVASEYILS
jgi:(2Fe-2S) ferredoxin